LGYSEYPDTRKLFNAIIQRRPFGAVIICVDCTGSCYSQFRIESDNLKIAYELFMYMSERLNLLLPGRRRLARGRQLLGTNRSFLRNT
jgi:hypothetical protein